MKLNDKHNEPMFLKIIHTKSENTNLLKKCARNDNIMTLWLCSGLLVFFL